MFREVDPQVSFVELEHDVLRFWEEDGTFGKLRAQNASGPIWSFLDGPITANNPMGVHHAWGRTYKDCYQRFHAMKGHRLRYQNGFDCQGLWVEVEVEKELGFQTKRDIETYGIGNFVDRCKQRASRFAAIQSEQSVRLGYWMDWSDSYYTMSDENNYTIWAFLKKCHNEGLIYRGRDSMPWCPRCGTGISQHEMHESYQEVTEDSVIVALPLREKPGERLLVWTTTPWTLPANVACAVHPELEYVAVDRDGDLCWLSAGSIGPLKLASRVVEGKRCKGADLVGLTYDGPFDELDAQSETRMQHRVIAWEMVSDAEGTGIVHIAPGCGREDFELSRELGLTVLAPIDESGVYIPGYGPLTGRAAREVAPTVFESLTGKGLLFRVFPYTHNYPHCWRCKTALLFRNVEEWFIDMKWRDRIKEVVRQIKWIPEWGMSQELDWLDNLRDWMISKKRYWGLALPFWVCDECRAFDVMGSKDELQQRAAEGWEAFDGHSPHRPWVDEVTLRCACGGVMHRVKDVGNPWLDAGIVPYSTTKYNTDRETWAEWVPADLVTECFPGQFRNWFYALLAMSTMMEGIPPFRTLLGHALVKDEHGAEMHKSAGNAIWFEDAAEKMGCDTMRWMYCRQAPANNLNFGYTPGEHVQRKVLSTLWNTYAFFSNYARADGFDPAAPQVPYADRPDVDRWILSELHRMVRTAGERLPEYDVAALVRQAEAFVEDLSNTYVRFNRRRFWRAKAGSDQDKLAAYQTLYECLTVFCRALAPVIPFVTDHIWRAIVSAQDPTAPQSVHLAAYPEADEALIDEALSQQMHVMASAISAVLALRNERQLRVRQPLARIVAVTGDETWAQALRRFEGELLRELNVKRIDIQPTLEGIETLKAAPEFRALGPRFRAGANAAAEAIRGLSHEQLVRLRDAGEPARITVAGEEHEVGLDLLQIKPEIPASLAATDEAGIKLLLDTELTPDLLAEGWARDAVRHIQQLRKESGLSITDRITLTVSTESPELRAALEAWAGYVANETLADRLAFGEAAEGDTRAEIGPASLALRIGLRDQPGQE